MDIWRAVILIVRASLPTTMAQFARCLVTVITNNRISTMCATWLTMFHCLLRNFLARQGSLWWKADTRSQKKRPCLGAIPPSALISISQVFPPRIITTSTSTLSLSLQCQKRRSEPAALCQGLRYPEGSPRDHLDIRCRQCSIRVFQNRRKRIPRPLFRSSCPFSATAP